MTQVSVGEYLLLIFAPFWQTVGAGLLSILPGWLLADRLKLDPLTKLLVAAFTSFTLMYLLAFGAYLASVPQWVAFAIMLIVSVASIADALRRRAIQIGAEPLPLDGLMAWLGLTIWILGLQSRVVVYGGSTWFGDWHEHYERMLFFLDHLPADSKFLYDQTTVPARAPMFNADLALLMSPFGRAFADYQGLATLLNTFVAIPMALLLRDMARLPQRAALFWSVVLLGIAPFAVSQETFPWTKSFTLAFILGGIHLYRAGLVQSRPWLAAGSFSVFTAGVLAHYLVLPFAAFFAVHFVYVAYRRAWNWRIILFPALGCTLLVATWGIYLVATFGLQATVTANSTFGEYGKKLPGPYGPPAARHINFLGNLVTTTVPYSWRHGFVGIGHAPPILQMDPGTNPDLRPAPTELNRRSEWLASISNNPSSMLGMLGFAGAIGVVIVAVLAIRRIPQVHPTPRASVGTATIAALGWKFWLIFFVIGIPLNILTSYDYQPHGTAHLNLQPYACLTAVLLFRTLRELPKWARACLIAVFLIESTVTTAAIMHLQERRVPIILEDGRFLLTAKPELNPVYVNNYILKLNTKAVFMSDRLGDLSGPFSLIAAVISMMLLTIGGFLLGAERKSAS